MTPTKGQKLSLKSLPKHQTNLREAIRDFGHEVISDFREQIGIRSRKNFGTLYSEEVLQRQESLSLEKLRRQLYQKERLRQEERLLFSAKEKEIKTKVTALQEEIRRMARTVKTLVKQSEIASAQTPIANPGVYHESFLEKLISFIKSLTLKIEKASVWLATWNNRAKKLPYYWLQAQKSGTKFMLSSERYMATQAG